MKSRYGHFLFQIEMTLWSRLVFFFQTKIAEGEQKCNDDVQIQNISEQTCRKCLFITHTSYSPDSARGKSVNSKSDNQTSRSAR